MKFINIFPTAAEIAERETARYEQTKKYFDPTHGTRLLTVDELIENAQKSYAQKAAEIMKAIEKYGSMFDEVADKAATNPNALYTVRGEIREAKRAAGLLNDRSREMSLIEWYIETLARRTNKRSGKKPVDAADIMDGVTEYKPIDE